MEMFIIKSLLSIHESTLNRMNFVKTGPALAHTMSGAFGIFESESRLSRDEDSKILKDTKLLLG
jgi:hypothetical protein